MIDGQLQKTRKFLTTALTCGFCPYSFTNAETASTEATAWAAISLLDCDASSSKTAIDFLIQNQNKDGGWSTSPNLGKSDWTSGPATLAIRLFSHYQQKYFDQGQFKQVLTNAFHYLLKSRVDFLSPVARLVLFLIDGPASLHYGRGWPWTQDCYNWVEPTAYSLMAFKLPGQVNEELAKSAIFHANKFLLEHACRGGGWNHGAFFCLGQYYAPYIVTTAEALLGLIDIPTDSKVKAALHYLSNATHNESSAMALAWSILALNAFDYSTDKEIKLLLELQNKDGSFGLNYFVTAISLMALNTANGINIWKGASK